MTLAEIAERYDLELRGDARLRVVGVCSLANGSPDRLSYLSDKAYAGELANTKAGAVIVTAEAAESCPVAALIADDPKLAYIRVAASFMPALPEPGIHPSAIIATTAQIDPTASVGARVVIGENVQIGPCAILSAGCVIDDNARIGEHSSIGANACIGRNVHLGKYVSIGPTAVLGARGFGLAHDGTAWQPIPQLGGVRVDDYVEIGAGSTVDRGAIEDTVIEQGAKIDDQVHIAHNCRIGKNTVIAGCTGIAGSCDIGANCVIGGGVGIGDHVTIVDNVMITGATQVPKSISKAGVYSSTLRAMPAGEWRKRLAIIRKLDSLQNSVRELRRSFKP